MDEARRSAVGSLVRRFRAHPHPARNRHLVSLIHADESNRDSMQYASAQIAAIPSSSSLGRDRRRSLRCQKLASVFHGQRRALLSVRLPGSHPRDANWVGERPTDNAGRGAAAELVAACRSEGLGAIAITDHHDLSFFPFVRRAAAGELDEDGVPVSAADRLVVFPGMELTLDIPCQALLILDADLPDDRLSLVIEALAIDPAPLNESLGSVERLAFPTFKALYEELNKREWLRGRYIVLPNVSEGGGSTVLKRDGKEIQGDAVRGSLRRRLGFSTRYRQYEDRHWKRSGLRK